LLYLIPGCTADVLLTAKRHIQQIDVIRLKYIKLVILFTTFSPIGQMDVVEFKYIKSTIHLKEKNLSIWSPSNFGTGLDTIDPN
jgi:hypothetical protein